MKGSCRTKASRIITECFGHAKHSRVVSAIPRILRPVYQGQKPRARPGKAALAKVREARGWTSGLRQGCQRLDRHQHRGTKTPTLWMKAVRQTSRGYMLHLDPPKRTPDVVKRPVPWSCRTEPKTPWGVPAAQAARANREHTRRGYTQFVWVADIGWTHRASFTAAGCKV